MQKTYPHTYYASKHDEHSSSRVAVHVLSIVRRAIDFLGASVGLLFLSPLFLLLAILIKRDSDGPIFFRGERVGKNGVPFKILKFRTMFERAESYQGSKVTGSNDARITPIGQWLRDTKLNELPQLWNVVVGEMSLVGPRPEDPAFVERWSTEEYETILSVRPGITSPTSIIYRDEESQLQADSVVDMYVESIMPSKLRLDMVYVRHRTLISDLDVILWTLVTLLPRLRDKEVTETRIMWGPLSELVSRYFSWLIVDFMSSLAAIAIAGLLWRSAAPLALGIPEALLIAIMIALVFHVLVTYCDFTKYIGHGQKRVAAWRCFLPL